MKMISNMYRLILTTSLIASAFWSALGDDKGSPGGLKSIVDEGEAHFTMSITVDDSASACTDAEKLVAYNNAALLSCMSKSLSHSLSLGPDVAFGELEWNENTRRLGVCKNCCECYNRRTKKCVPCRRSLVEMTNGAVRQLRGPTSPDRQLKTCWEEHCESNPDTCMCQGTYPGFSLTNMS